MRYRSAQEIVDGIHPFDLGPTAEHIAGKLKDHGSFAQIQSQRSHISEVDALYQSSEIEEEVFKEEHASYNQFMRKLLLRYITEGKVEISDKGQLVAKRKPMFGFM